MDEIIEIWWRYGYILIFVGWCNCRQSLNITRMSISTWTRLTTTMRLMRSSMGRSEKMQGNRQVWNHHQDRKRQIFRSIHGDVCRWWQKCCHQSAQTRQKEQNQKGNQDSQGTQWTSRHHRTQRCRQGPRFQIHLTCTSPSTQVFDHIDNVDFRSLIPGMTDLEIRFYLFELLKVILNPLRRLTTVTAEVSCIETSSPRTSLSITTRRFSSWLIGVWLSSTTWARTTTSGWPLVTSKGLSSWWTTTTTTTLWISGRLEPCLPQWYFFPDLDLQKGAVLHGREQSGSVGQDSSGLGYWQPVQVSKEVPSPTRRGVPQIVGEVSLLLCKEPSEAMEQVHKTRNTNTLHRRCLGFVVKDADLRPRRAYHTTGGHRAPLFRSCPEMINVFLSEGIHQSNHYFNHLLIENIK